MHGVKGQGGPAGMWQVWHEKRAVVFPSFILFSGNKKISIIL